MADDYDEPRDPGSKPKKPKIDLSREHLQDLTKSFKSLQAQKHKNQGGVEGRVLINLAMYLGEQWVWHEHGRLLNKSPRKNQPLIIINKIKARVRKLIGRLSAVIPEFRAIPDTPDPDKMSMSMAVNRLDYALDEKLDESQKAWQRWWHSIVAGGCMEYTSFRPDVTCEPMAVLGPDGRSMWLLDPGDGSEPQPVSDTDRSQMLQPPMDPMGQPMVDPQTGQPMQPQYLPEQFEPMEELELTGDVVSEILGPLNVFAPTSLTSVEDMSPDEQIGIAKIRTVEWIRRNYPDAELDELGKDTEFRLINTDITQVGAAFSNHNLKDLIPVIQGTKGANDPDMEIVVELFQPPSQLLPKGWSGKEDAKYGGRYTVFVPDKVVLLDQELPYEDGIPLVDFHWGPVTTNFFTDALLDDAVPIQKAINKMESQIHKFLNAWVQSPVLVDDDFDADKWPTDDPGFVKGGMRDGGPTVTRMQPPNLPGWIAKEKENLYKQFDDVMGGADLFKEFKFPGQIRGSSAFPMLQEILDTEWGPVLKHYGKRLARVKSQRINRVKQFYPESRIMHYVSRQQKSEVFEFKASEILRSGVDFNISVEPASLTPELRNMKESRIRDRLESPLAFLYTDEQTGQLDKNRIASELQFGDIGRETADAVERKFAKKVIQMITEGKAPPPVLPFQTHMIYIQEARNVINDMDFFEFSEPVQQALIARVQEHQQIMDQVAQEQAQAQQAQQQDGMVNQAVQQATAKLAAQMQEEMFPQIMQYLMETLQTQGPQAVQQMMEQLGGQQQQAGPEQPQM